MCESTGKLWRLVDVAAINLGQLMNKSSIQHKSFFSDDEKNDGTMILLYAELCWNLTSQSHTSSRWPQAKLLDGWTCGNVSLQGLEGFLKNG